MVNFKKSNTTACLVIPPYATAFAELPPPFAAQTPNSFSQVFHLLMALANLSPTFRELSQQSHAGITSMFAGLSFRHSFAQLSRAFAPQLPRMFQASWILSHDFRTASANFRCASYHYYQTNFFNFNFNFFYYYIILI